MITIVAMFTIVAINHNCRNTNHNCRKKNTIVAMPTTIVVIWSTTIVATPITIVVIFSKNFWLCKHYCMVQAWSFLRLSWSQPHFSQYCCYFALLNSTIYTCSIQFECWDQIWLYLLYFSTMFAINCTFKNGKFPKNGICR